MKYIIIFIILFTSCKKDLQEVSLLSNCKVDSFWHYNKNAYVFYSIESDKEYNAWVEYVFKKYSNKVTNYEYKSQDIKINTGKHSYTYIVSDSLNTLLTVKIWSIDIH